MQINSLSDICTYTYSCPSILGLPMEMWSCIQGGLIKVLYDRKSHLGIKISGLIIKVAFK